jgi:nucleoside-diphosphate-sugar epimerase
MRALVTGGSGYFGSLLLRRLLASGAECTVFDLVDADDRPASVGFHRGDIRDPAAVRAACRGVDVVHHNVAQVPLAKDRALFESVNVEGTRILLEASLAERVRKVVYVSSSAVYGIPDRNPVTEDTPPRPREPYGRAKWEGEVLCADYVRRGLDVSIVRPRTIMGHGRLGIFQILFEWIREGHNVPVLGRGDNVYQFVHADDLADACLRAAERPGSRDYNIGTDRFGTMREVLQALCAHARTGSRVRSLPRRPMEVGMRLASALGVSPLGPYHWMMYGRSMWFDTERARRELDWKPRASNVEMFVESYEWYLRHREEVLRAHGASHHRSAVKERALWVVKHLL